MLSCQHTVIAPTPFTGKRKTTSPTKTLEYFDSETDDTMIEIILPREYVCVDESMCRCVDALIVVR